VIADCGPADNLSDLQTITSVVGHETGEASTDPFTNPTGQAAWRITDTDSPWYFTSGEVGDLCHSNYYTDSETGFVAQRIWSISAALGNGSPCVPLPPTNPTPFMAASASDSIYFVAAGQSTTIVASPWSTGPTNNWYLGMFVFGGQIANLGIQAANPVSGYPAFTSVNNGKPAQFTVTVPAGTPSGQYAYLWLSSDISGLPGDADWWPVVVEVP
jgi:hypothetical protein